VNGPVWCALNSSCARCNTQLLQDTPNQWQTALCVAQLDIDAAASCNLARTGGPQSVIQPIFNFIAARRLKICALQSDLQKDWWISWIRDAMTPAAQAQRPGR